MGAVFGAQEDNLGETVRHMGQSCHIDLVPVYGVSRVAMRHSTP